VGRDRERGVSLSAFRMRFDRPSSSELSSSTVFPGPSSYGDIPTCSRTLLATRASEALASLSLLCPSLPPSLPIPALTTSPSTLPSLRSATMLCRTAPPSPRLRHPEPSKNESSRFSADLPTARESHTVLRSTKRLPRPNGRSQVGKGSGAGRKMRWQRRVGTLGGC
jgi:hypothetical protein